MLIFCCIRSPSLCTLALHIAGSLWRLDFNHSVPFQVPSSLSPLRPPASSGPSPSLVHPIYMHNCLWSIYLSPLVSHPPACAHSRTREREREKGGGTKRGQESLHNSDNIFPLWILLSPSPLGKCIQVRVFSDSHVLLAVFHTSPWSPVAIYASL